MGGANSIGKAILLDTIRCAEREDAGGITKNKKVSIDFLIALHVTNHMPDVSALKSAWGGIFRNKNV